MVVVWKASLEYWKSLLDDGKAVVTFDESAVSIPQLIETIEDAGFYATE